MNTHKTHKTRASVRIDTELWAWAKEEAKRRALTVSGLAEELIGELKWAKFAESERRRGGVAAGEQG